jgi:hypothetical protein
MSIGRLIVYAAAIAVVLVVVPAAAVIVGCRVAGHARCDTFERETGRETKWIVYHALDTGDCLTPSSDGRWIPTSQLRDVAP